MLNLLCTKDEKLLIRVTVSCPKITKNTVRPIPTQYCSLKHTAKNLINETPCSSLPLVVKCD